MINKIQGPGQLNQGVPAAQQPQKTTGAKPMFGAMLQQESAAKTAGAAAGTAGMPGTTAQRPVNFSKHALERAEERGIELTPVLMDRLANSVEKAQEKGATNILAFDDSRAFIVNIPYGRVITTMSQEEMKENIFTNIDGAVLL